MKTTEKKLPIGDAAVQARTGKKWAEWFNILDDAGARKMNHQEIVAYLGGCRDRTPESRYQLSPWWTQMVTVAYEQARGMREKHQRPEGYQISGSKTVGVSVSALFRAWQDEKARNRWLGEKSLVIRKATANRSMRITWSDRKTSVEVNFYPRGESKSQVTVQHSKLPDAKAAERMKAYWAKALDRLKGSLEAYRRPGGLIRGAGPT